MITFESKLTKALSEASRRDFLKKMASGAAAAATGDPTAIAKSLGVNPSILQLSDEELTATPEQEWIGIIPAARLARMINSGTYEYDREMQHKLDKALIYGANNIQGAPVLKMMIDSLTKTGKSPKNLITKAFELSDDPNRYGFLGYNLGDSLDTRWTDVMDNDESWLNNHTQSIFDKIGIKMPPAVKKLIKGKEYLIKKNHYHAKQKQLKREQPPEKITPRPDDNLASPMHQPFESKLTKALRSIKG